MIIWLGHQDQRWFRAKTGYLAAARIADLDAVPGWAWDARAAKWEAGWQALVSFVERTGHARVPPGHLEDGFRLGQWVRVQRSWAASGRLTQVRAARLAVLPGWTGCHERLDL